MSKDNIETATEHLIRLGRGALQALTQANAPMQTSFDRVRGFLEDRLEESFGSGAAWTMDARFTYERESLHTGAPGILLFVQHDENRSTKVFEGYYARLRKIFGEFSDGTGMGVRRAGDANMFHENSARLGIGLQGDPAQLVQAIIAHNPRAIRARKAS